MIYIDICNSYLSLFFHLFVFVLVIVTRTRKSPRIGSLSKSWISLLIIGQLGGELTPTVVWGTLRHYLDILEHGSKIGFKISLQNWKKVLISWAWPPPFASRLLLWKLIWKSCPKGLERELHPAVMIYLSNSWSRSPSTPGQSLLSWLAAEETHGTWKHKSQ